MAYEFKNLSDVDTLETVGDDTKILGLDAGNPVQIPASSVSRAVYLIDFSDDQFTQNDTVGGLVSNSETLGDEIIQAMRAGKNIWMVFKTTDSTDSWCNDFGARITSTDGKNYLRVYSYYMDVEPRCFPTTYTSIFEG